MPCPHSKRPGASPDRCSQCVIDPRFVERHAAPTTTATQHERAIRIKARDEAKARRDARARFFVVKGGVE